MMSRWTLLGVVLLIALGAAIVFPLFTRSREMDGGSPNSRCLSNVKNLAMAVEMYVMDYNRGPNPRAWSDQLMEYVRIPDIFRCPEAPQLRCAYAFNDGASGASERSLESPEAARLVTIFESDRGWNAHGGRESLPAKPRYLGGENYGFLDGHGKWVARGDEGGVVEWWLKAGKARPR